MKRKHYILGIAMVATILASACMLSHIQSINASRTYHSLSGVSIILDPGHGGKDDGARAGNVKEQEINLKIAKKLETLLKNNGASVTLTRTGAYDLASANATNRKREDMKKRMEIINADKTDLFLSIHLNAYPNTSVKGAQAFYEKDNEVSKVFADIIQKNFKKLTGTNMTSKRQGKGPAGRSLPHRSRRVGYGGRCKPQTVPFVVWRKTRQKVVTYRRLAKQ